MSVTKTLRRRRGWIGLGVVVALAATAYLVYRDAQPTVPQVTYQTDTAAVGTISVTVAGTGNVELADTTEVYPEVSGAVSSIAVDEGSSVATGTVLFTLDSSDAEAATAQAYSSYLQAQQGVAQAKSQLSRAENNLATVRAGAKETTPTATADDVELAELEVDAAEAALASAQSQQASAATAYENARDAEDELSVTSPCSGIVWDVAVDVGDTVSASSSEGSGASGLDGGADSGTAAPMTIAPEQPYAVRLTVNEVDLPAVAVGQRADIEFDALPDLAATGKVYDIAEEGSNASGVVTFDVWLALDVVDPALRLGMSAGATIVTDVARDALIVPNAAVRAADDGGSYVLVMDDGATEPREVPVQTGLSSSTQTQVLSGIEEGTVVVTQTIDSSDTSGPQFGPGGGVMMRAGTTSSGGGEGD